MRWPRLRIRLTIELGGDERSEAPKPEPSYGDGWMDNSGTLVESIGQPRMVGFQREDAVELTESDLARRRVQ